MMAGNKNKATWFLFTTLLSIFNICTIRIFDGYNWPFYAVTVNAVFSLGGLIFRRMMTIPKDGTHPGVECYGLRIRVEEIVDRRVEWATVTVLDGKNEADEQERDEKQKD